MAEKTGNKGKRKKSAAREGRRAAADAEARPTKAERRAARGGRRRAATPAPEAAEQPAAAIATEEVEERLGRIEEAVAEQAEQSRVLLSKVEALLVSEDSSS